MRKDGLNKFYDRFTPDERFRLAVEAMAREDVEELERLAGTCPRVTLMMTELPYANRIRISQEMTMAVCLDLAPRLAKLDAMKAIREATSHILEACINEADIAYFGGYERGSRRAWEVAGKTGDPPGWGKWEEGKETLMEEDLRRKITGFLERVTGGFLARLDELEHSVTRDAFTTWEAFASFCKGELGLDPEKLVNVWIESMLPEIEKLKNLPDPPEVDREGLKEYKAALTRSWQDLLKTS